MINLKFVANLYLQTQIFEAQYLELSLLTYLTGNPTPLHDHPQLHASLLHISDLRREHPLKELKQ